MPVFKDTEYLALVDAALKDPMKADWKAIRQLYIESSFYDDARRNGLSGGHYSNLGKKALAANTPETIAAYKEDMRKYAGAIDMQWQAYNLLKQDKASFVDEAYTSAAMKGLMAALLATGDGRTMKTAFQVTTVAEEYILMRSYYGLMPKQQTLERGDGHMFDVHRVSNSKSEDVGEIFFNIDLYFGKMELPKELMGKLKSMPQAKRPPPKSEEESLPPEDKDYLALVDAAMKDPASANWDAIRSHYPATNFYKGVGGLNLAHYSAEMLAHLATRMSAEAIDAYKKFQRLHYACVAAHSMSLTFYKDKKNDFINPADEQKAVDGILQSLRRSGDGKTPETAFKAVDLDEASQLAQVLMTGRPDFSSVTIAEQKYAVYRGADRASGTAMTAYFSLDPRTLQAGIGAPGMPSLASVTVSDPASIAKAADNKAAAAAEKLLADPHKGDNAKSTYIVMDLDGDGLKLGNLDKNDGVYWDIDADGFAEATSWPHDAFLGIDLNGDGTITRLSELFAVDGTNSYNLLAKMDDNRDGVLDARDAVWTHLLLWLDLNRNGSPEKEELFSLADKKVQSINLTTKNEMKVEDGNTIVSSSEFSMLDDTGKPARRKMAAVYLNYSDVNTVDRRGSSFDLRSMLLPQFRGYGVLGDLYQSMARDNNGQNNLRMQVQSLANLPFDALVADPYAYEDRVNNILYRWARADGIDPHSRGPNMDARQLRMLEMLMGEKFVQIGAGGLDNPLFWAGLDMHHAYNELLSHFLAALSVQVYGGYFFTGSPSYDANGDTMHGVKGLNIEKINIIAGLIGKSDSVTIRKRAWVEVARIIEFGTAKNGVPEEDFRALDAIIARSMPGVSYGSLLKSAHSVDMRSLPGNDYANKVLGISAKDGDILEVARAARRKEDSKQIVYSDVATEIMQSCCKSQQEVVTYLRDRHYKVNGLPVSEMRKSSGEEIPYTAAFRAVWQPNLVDKVRDIGQVSAGFNLIIVFMNGDKVEWVYAHTQK
ncbi:MAG: hypothetical protein PW788_07665 [Micavibrio sp.]|nr:hypothetical protein [Micavibrio sp.]